jgi:hypothetical protein
MRCFCCSRSPTLLPPQSNHSKNCFVSHNSNSKYQIIPSTVDEKELEIMNNSKEIESNDLSSNHNSASQQRSSLSITSYQTTAPSGNSTSGPSGGTSMGGRGESVGCGAIGDEENLHNYSSSQSQRMSYSRGTLSGYGTSAGAVGGAGGGSLYYFTPNKYLPKLRLFDNKTLNSSLKAILRKKTLLLLYSSPPPGASVTAPPADPPAAPNQGTGPANGNGGGGIDYWNYVVAGEIEGWCQLNIRNPYVSQAIRSVSSYRRYHEWRGLNFFFYHGKIMFGSDFYFFLWTNVLYVTPSLFYFIFVIPFMYQPLLSAVFMLLIFFYSLYNLWLAALTEPGIIPRNPPQITV